MQFIETCLLWCCVDVPAVLVMPNRPLSTNTTWNYSVAPQKEISPTPGRKSMTKSSRPFTDHRIQRRESSLKRNTPRYVWLLGSPQRTTPRKSSSTDSHPCVALIISHLHLIHSLNRQSSSVEGSQAQYGKQTTSRVKKTVMIFYECDNIHTLFCQRFFTQMKRLHSVPTGVCTFCPSCLHHLH